ncbi:MAG: TetR family transcriptional regulator [Candidatus Nanopelagicales bacterium]
MGTDDVRDAVLDSARAAFHARGYVRTSIKGVAAAAGVAPEVVNRYWNSKESLFAAAMRLPFDPASAVPELVAPGLDGMGERLTRATLDLLADEDSRNDFIALFQAGASATKAARGMQDYIERSIVDRLVRTLGVPDARLRVNLIVAYLMGIATTRYIVRLEPVASMPEDDLVKLVAPTIQGWLDPTKPLRPNKSNSTKSSGGSAIGEPKPRGGR